MAVDGKKQGAPRVMVWGALYLCVVIAIVFYLVFSTPDQAGLQNITTRTRHLTSFGSNPLCSPDGGSIAFCGDDAQAGFSGPGISVVYSGGPQSMRVWLTPAYGGATYEVVGSDNPVYSWVEGSTAGGPAWRLAAAGVDNTQASVLVLAECGPQGSQSTCISAPDDLVFVSYAPTGTGRLILHGTPPTFELSDDDTGPDNTSFETASGTGASDEKMRPVWSPDGRYAACMDTGSGLTVWDPAGNRTSSYSEGMWFRGYFGRHISWHPTQPILIHEIWSEDVLGAAGASGGPIVGTARGESCVGVGWFNVETEGGGILYRSMAGGDCFSPVWHPSGRFIACMTMSDQPILIEAKSLAEQPNVNLGICRTRSTQRGASYGRPWQGCDLGSWLSWSPDGRRLAYGRNNGGIVTFEFDIPGATIEDLWK